MNGICYRYLVGLQPFFPLQQPERPSCCQSDLLLKTSCSARIGTGKRPS